MCTLYTAFSDRLNLQLETYFHSFPFHFICIVYIVHGSICSFFSSSFWSVSSFNPFLISTCETVILFLHTEMKWRQRLLFPHIQHLPFSTPSIGSGNWERGVYIVHILTFEFSHPLFASCVCGFYEKNPHKPIKFGLFS